MSVPGAILQAGARGPKRGQAAVEFALVGTILIFVLFGILEVSRLILVNTEVENAAREAAQYMALRPDDNAGAYQNMKDRAKARLFLADRNAITIDNPTFPNGNCAFAKVQVAVHYTWTSSVRFVPPVQMNYSSTKIIEIGPNCGP